MEENTQQGAVQENPQQGLMQPLSAQQGGKQTDPAMQKKVDGYVSILMKIMHAKSTRNTIIKMLSASDDPKMSIVETALAVNDLAVQEAKSAEPKVILAASPYLVSDLAEIGNAAGIFQLNEEQLAPIYQAALQKYIEKGLKDGSIDPVELQASVEPMLSQEQNQMGMDMGQQTGLPQQASNSMAVRTMTQEAKPTPQPQQQQAPQQGLLGGR